MNGQRGSVIVKLGVVLFACGAAFYSYLCWPYLTLPMRLARESTLLERAVPGCVGAARLPSAERARCAVRLGAELGGPDAALRRAAARALKSLAAASAADVAGARPDLERALYDADAQVVSLACLAFYMQGAAAAPSIPALEKAREERPRHADDYSEALDHIRQQLSVEQARSAGRRQRAIGKAMRSE